MVPEVDLESFAAAHADGAFVIDVREPHEYVEGHVPGAKLIPLADLPQQTAGLASREPVYVICASGHRSLSAAQFLARRGIDAKSVADGTTGWINRGLPVVYGEMENGPGSATT
jgi:rhodanese-related sulfurtransferase